MLDKDYKCLYVGYSGRENLNDRMKEHLGKHSNIPGECVDSIARIDYKEYKYDDVARRSEVQHIRRYDPVYNIDCKRNGSWSKIPRKIVIMEDGWKIFKEIEPMNEIPEYVKPMQYLYLYSVLIFGIVSLIYMISNCTWTLI